MPPAGSASPLPLWCAQQQCAPWAMQEFNSEDADADDNADADADAIADYNDFLNDFLNQ